jgi:hypothetical protein
VGLGFKQYHKGQAWVLNNTTEPKIKQKRKSMTTMGQWMGNLTFFFFFLMMDNLASFREEPTMG